MQLLPAGVPRNLRNLQRRLAGLLEGAPVLFLGVVLGVALVFRLGIAFLQPAAAADAPASMTSTVAAPGAAAPVLPVQGAEAPRPKGHIVDPPPVASGRQRAEPAPAKKKLRGFFRTSGAPSPRAD